MTNAKTPKTVPAKEVRGSVNFTRRNRITGHSQTVARASELGIDTADQGEWATVCNEHNQHGISANLKLAALASGLDYCDGCRKEAKDREKAAAKAAADAAKATTKVEVTA
jgi:hypothetical protein